MTYAAQAVHMSALDCDFFAFSSHKMLKVLWARKEILEMMAPFMEEAI